jgi:hypothetical protein
MADATDLRKLECSPGKPAMQNCSNSGKPKTCPGEGRGGNPEPSPDWDSSREGVETRRAAPKPRTVSRRTPDLIRGKPDIQGDGEGIVQTANLA